MTGKLVRNIILSLVVLMALAVPFEGMAQRHAIRNRHHPDTTRVAIDTAAYAIVEEPIQVVDNEVEVDTAAAQVVATVSVPLDEWEEADYEFNPDPTRAVWMSALFPGMGQVYNRRYWKLPIIVGGYLGLAYATSWNNTMLSDYTRAYRDIMDSDPSTNSYMNFFPPTVKEEDLDQAWLQNVLKSRKNYFRRNRDLCIICMVGVYLLAMLDAYVDASLSHFDITPDLSIDVSPTLIQDGRGVKPSIGLVWAFNF